MTAPAFNTNLPRSNLGYTVPLSVGSTTAVSGIGTPSQSAIVANPSRRRITFINPNVTANLTLFVCQATDKNGNALSAGDGVAGSIPIFPGATVVLEGQCQMAFNVAASASSAALTIIEDEGQ